MADEKTVTLIWEVQLGQLIKAEKVQKSYNAKLKATEKALQGIFRQSRVMAAGGEKMLSLEKSLAGAFAESQRITEQYNQTLQEQVAAREQVTQATGKAADELGEHTAAAERSAEATRKNTEEQKRQESAVKGSSVAWGRAAKRLLLYTVGAASVFRVVMKLRREFNENIEILFKNTEELQGMKEAQDDLKASVLAFLGTEESFKRYFEFITERVKGFIDNLVKLRAQIDKLKFLVDELRPTGEALVEARGTVLSQRGLREVIENLQDAGGSAQLAADAQGVYNQSIEESQARIEEWGDAITKAREEGEKGTDRLTDAQKRYQRLLEQLVRAEEQRIRDLIDLYDDYERKIEDIIEETNRALADLATEGARRREDIERTYQRKLEDIERSARENRTKNEERLRLKLLRIEMRYRERLIRIQEDFDDSMYDAIAKRDATAALLAIRRRQREEGRAKRERDNAITLAKAEFNAQINEQRRALERMREDAKIARQRSLEDLAVHLARERQDIQTNHERELEDLDTFLERRRADIERDYEWQTARANAHYTQNEQMYTAHLQRQLSALQNHYLQVVALHNAYAGILAQPVGAPVGGATTSTGAIPGFAEGGVGLFTRPTRINVAEDRPEIVIAQPVSTPDNVSISGNIQHQIMGSVSAAMEGMEGRLGAAITEQVVRVMGEVL